MNEVIRRRSRLAVLLEYVIVDFVYVVLLT